MIKKLSLLFFAAILALNSILVYSLSANGLDSLEDSLQWIQDGRSGGHVRYFKNYRKEFIDKQEKDMLNEQRQLEIKQIIVPGLLALAAAGIFAYLFIPWYRTRTGPFFVLAPHTGLAISAFAVLLFFSFSETINFFSAHFTEIPNANTHLAINVYITTLALLPLLFFTGYIVSLRERKKGLIKSQWVIILSFCLFLLSAALILFIGLLLSGPDLKLG